MSSVNKIVLVGHLTADPEVKVTTEGTSLTKFTLEVDRPFGASDKTDQISVVSWGKLAEEGALFHKEALVLVEGRIQVRSYDDKDGEKAWATEVVANYMRTLDKKGDSSAGPSSATPAGEDMTEDDIPF